MTDLPFEGRVALVAGASRGIGAATAEAFAAAGAAVVLGARDMAALESVVKRIEAGGGRALAVRSDVADAESSRKLVEAAATARWHSRSNQEQTGPASGRLDLVRLQH